MFLFSSNFEGQIFNCKADIDIYSRISYLRLKWKENGNYEEQFFHRKIQKWI